jgi:hypothetical protein
MRSRSTGLTKLYEKSMDLGPVTGPSDLGRVPRDAFSACSKRNVFFHSGRRLGQRDKDKIRGIEC